MIQIDLERLMPNINPAFVPVLTNKDRWLILYGGAGSGKSVAIAQKFVLRILKGMNKGKKHRFLCLRKTKPAAKKSILSLFKDILESWQLQGLYTINKTDMTITFIDGSEIIITGMDDPEKIKSIHKITSIWLEEITEFTHDDFKQLGLRLRGFTWDYFQIVGSFNPIDEQHWLRKKVFTDELQAEIEAGAKFVRKVTTIMVGNKPVNLAMTIMHSTYHDNLFIDPAYKALLESYINEDVNYYNVYTLGKWGLLKGLIFENWDQVDTWPTELEPIGCGGFGIDFGFTVHPSVIVEAGFVGNDLYLREHLYQTGLSNKEITKALFLVTEGKAGLPTVADSAEPKSIAEIRSYDHPCMAAAKGKDSILYGIQRMKQYRIHILKDSIWMIKEFQGYKWAEDKKTGDPVSPAKPVKIHDHTIDATRYIVTKLKGGVPVHVHFSDTEKKQIDPENIFTDGPDPDKMVDDGLEDESMWVNC